MCGDASKASTTANPAARAAGLSAPAGAATVKTSCMSPWLNFSASNRAAAEDSAVGSWKPPADRLLATGTPNTAAEIVSSTANAMMRRGAAMAMVAIRPSTGTPLVAGPRGADR